jgi:pimeloyl-ACP methyl ester carboxylesterase
VQAANAWRQLWAAAQFSAASAAPPCPTLLLSSRADRLVNPRCSVHLAQVWRVHHEQHPWAGHDLPHDDADWICRAMTDWQGAR